ncbi:MAG: RIP metalloprotease RseP [Clostridiales bacterium]|nr:RIP metalloprotease RseP [Clostridiales bacterium]
MLTLLCDFTSVMKTVGYVLLAFVVLMVMVLIHETGHYAAGKLLGFQINEFAVGMGPKILSRKKKNGEVFSLRLLPLGGFCAFEGENDDTDNPKAFHKQKPWKRLIVLFAGAFFNFISAILIAIIVFACYGETVVVVNNVYEYAPEVNQQLQSGDIIYKVNGKRVYMLDSLSRYFTDDEMSITVLRDTNGDGKYEKETLHGVKQDVFTPVTLTKVDGKFYSVDGNRKLQPNDTVYKLEGKLLSKDGDWSNQFGLAGETLILTVIDGNTEYDYQLSKSDFYNSAIVAEQQASYSGIGMSIHYDKYKFGFGESLVRVVPYCCEVGMLVLRTLGGLLTGVVGIESVGGPITTISMTTQVIQTGFGNVLMLIVLISVNLAVFNLLPVPALDGCQMIFVLIEWIARKPINRKVQSYINGIGLIVLIALMLLIDILKL